MGEKSAFNIRATDVVSHSQVSGRRSRSIKRDARHRGVHVALHMQRRIRFSLDLRKSLMDESGKRRES